VKLPKINIKFHPRSKVYDFYREVFKHKQWKSAKKFKAKPRLQRQKPFYGVKLPKIKIKRLEVLEW
jgi:hypothetical protein